MSDGSADDDDLYLSLDRKTRYALFRQTPAWDSIRGAVRKRRYCEACSIPSTTHDAHHRHYPERFGEEADSDLVLLCTRCHAEVHRLVASGAALGEATDIVVSSRRGDGARHELIVAADNRFFLWMLQVPDLGARAVLKEALVNLLETREVSLEIGASGQDERDTERLIDLARGDESWFVPGGLEERASGSKSREVRLRLGPRIGHP